MCEYGAKKEEAEVPIIEEQYPTVKMPKPVLKHPKDNPDHPAHKAHLQYTLQTELHLELTRRVNEAIKAADDKKLEIVKKDKSLSGDDTISTVFKLPIPKAPSWVSWDRGAFWFTCP